MSSNPLTQADNSHWHYTQEMKIVKLSANGLHVTSFSEPVFASTSKMHGNLTEQGGIVSRHSQWHFPNRDLGPPFFLTESFFFCMFNQPVGGLPTVLKSKS
jgi:hypothetical protein